MAEDNPSAASAFSAVIRAFAAEATPAIRVIRYQSHGTAPRSGNSAVAEQESAIWQSTFLEPRGGGTGIPTRREERTRMQQRADRPGLAIIDPRAGLRQ
jgi:hypothetical protein